MAAPHFHGHRERLRTRFIEGGSEALPDYELLELVLMGAIPRRDVKQLAKDLIAQFGSFAEVMAAPPKLLEEVKGLGTVAITELKVIEAAAQRLARGKVDRRKPLSSWTAVIDYCRTSHGVRRQGAVPHPVSRQAQPADRDEVQQTGTVDHTPVYPREVVKRALELSATAIILVHNHPSGDPTPSRADIEMTKEIAAAAKPLGIAVHDHIIVGKDGHTSLRGLGVM